MALYDGVSTWQRDPHVTASVIVLLFASTAYGAYAACQQNGQGVLLGLIGVHIAIMQARLISLAYEYGRTTTAPKNKRTTLRPR